MTRFCPFSAVRYMCLETRPRGSGEMADAHALGACALTGVRVRIPPSPPNFMLGPYARERCGRARLLIHYL